MRIQDFGKATLDYIAMPFKYFAGQRRETEAKAEGISRESFSAREEPEAQNSLAGRISHTIFNLPGIRQIIDLVSAIFGKRSEPEADVAPPRIEASSKSSPSISSSSSPPPSLERSSSAAPSSASGPPLAQMEPVEIHPFLENEENSSEIEANALAEQKIPDDGACMFHAVRQQLGALMTYLQSNKLLTEFGNKLPDDMQLRLRALAYMRENYNSDPKMRGLVDFAVKDYNDKRIEKLGEEIVNFSLLFSEIEPSLQNNHYNEITRIMQAMFEDGVSPQLDNLRREVTLYKSTLKDPAAAQAKQLVEQLERDLDSAKPVSLETYLDEYRKKDFFANRDALYALSQILRVDFHIYQHFIARGASQPDSNVLLKPGDPRVFAYRTSEDDPGLHDQMAPVAYLTFRNGRHYNVLVRP